MTDISNDRMTFTKHRPFSFPRLGWTLIIGLAVIYTFLVHTYLMVSTRPLPSIPISRQVIAVATAHHHLHPSPCSPDTHILVLIGSHPDHSEVRDVLRASWSRTPILKHNLKLVFVFGLLDDPTKQHKLSEEHDNQSDILQGRFADSYHNVTVRDLMGFQWAVDNCPNIKYIIRIDDDIAVDIYSLVKYLNDQQLDGGDYVGCFNIVRQPKVQRWGRYAISTRDYPQDFYDDYCQGWLYVATPSAVRKWMRASNKTKAFWINDVYITGTLTTVANLSLAVLPLRYTDYYTDMIHLVNSPGLITQDNYFQLGPTRANAQLTQNIHQLSTNFQRSTCK